MPANALVQTRIDADLKERATLVLEKLGLSVSDVVRVVLTRVANEGGLPIGLLTDSKTHDAWFRAKVMEAIRDDRPTRTHEAVEAEFATRRAKATHPRAKARPS